MRRSRNAFTLVEILVVLAIVASLTPLMASAVLVLVEVQQSNNTQTVALIQINRECSGERAADVDQGYAACRDSPANATRVRPSDVGACGLRRRVLSGQTSPSGFPFADDRSEER